MVTGQTFLADIFSIWGIAYFIYDYTTLIRVYGNGSPLLQWHHVGEALIATSYASFPVAAAYITGGGLMQLSSGLLHIHRIISVCNIKISPNLHKALNWSLIVTWAHARLIAFPLVMWRNLFLFPMSFIHAALLLVGFILITMNSIWMMKIAKMKNLAY